MIIRKYIGREITAIKILYSVLEIAQVAKYVVCYMLHRDIFHKKRNKQLMKICS